jgi:outer membrane protein assembly factor BamB
VGAEKSSGFWQFLLRADELSVNLQSMLKRVDTNGDGSLDQAELKAVADSFAKRREGSQAGARDPIVYGVAAVDGAIIIRTGTRLYCVSNRESDQVAGGNQWIV